ncbi:hypothetical protein BDV25DRAFT_82920 [Aspergillus avenaceus]|uniref:Uncharacterized protein n=1 Tax=Aspergillus avenaceus TaxID=36643 RepID=A0A5N6U9Q4_ASPAV|nr:hypothetical protein BDV25DRAFT_82920 [Aspergillus avenaceus]
MASLSFSKRENSTWELETKLYEFVTEYVQPSSTTIASDAAAKINEWAKESQSANDLENFLWQTWGLVIEIAEQIPCDHPAQERLVHLIQALRKLPPQTVRVWDEDLRLWEDLPLLGPNLREAWNLVPSDKPSPSEVNEWVSLNSFTARLLALGGVPWYNFAIWSLREGLEEECPETAVDCHLAVAREWFRHSGPVLRQQATVAETKEERMLAGGSLYQGPAKLCPERWTFWKERLDQIGRQEGNAGKDAVNVKEIMDQVEAA